MIFLVLGKNRLESPLFVRRWSSSLKKLPIVFFPCIFWDTKNEDFFFKVNNTHSSKWASKLKLDLLSSLGHGRIQRRKKINLLRQHCGKHCSQNSRVSNSRLFKQPWKESGFKIFSCLAYCLELKTKVDIFRAFCCLLGNFFIMSIISWVFRLHFV